MAFMRRPTGNNADEWQLFLQEWLTIENGRINGTAFMAVQIAEAIDTALAQSDAEPKRDGARPIPFDRDTGGRLVREAWIRWAKTQPNPKPSWLVPYDELSEPDKEADRQIAETVARWTLIHDATLAQSDAEPALPQALRDAAENLLIAIGMGWDIEGCIENLRAALAQSDVKPVAWQTRAIGSKNWYIWQREGAPYDHIDPEFFDVRPLYTAPPRLDASAGLIEAAEYLIDRLQACLKGKPVRDLGEALAAYESARAADRSGK